MNAALSLGSGKEGRLEALPMEARSERWWTNCQAIVIYYYQT